KSACLRYKHLLILAQLLKDIPEFKCSAFKEIPHVYTTQ
ncbi:MAG: hypothetical protein ACI8PG_004000, partial [Planctomycetota bacterium]